MHKEIKGSNIEDISGTLIDLTGKRMKQFYQKMLKNNKFDVTVDQFIILQVLSETNGLPQMELGKRTFKDKPTTTRIIGLLEKKELVIRKANTKDRRIYNIFLTMKGKELIKNVMPVLVQFRKIAWYGLSDNEMRTLLSLLDKICDNLNQPKLDPNDIGSND